MKKKKKKEVKDDLKQYMEWTHQVQKLQMGGKQGVEGVQEKE